MNKNEIGAIKEKAKLNKKSASLIFMRDDARDKYRYVTEKRKAETEKIEKVLSKKSKRTILYTVIGATLLGIALGYGASFLVPDNSLRRDAIPSPNSNFLQAPNTTIDKSITGITYVLPTGYTKEQIEANYLLKEGKTNLPGVSAEYEVPYKSSFKFDEHTKKTEIASSYKKKGELFVGEIYLASKDKNGLFTFQEKTKSYIAKSNFIKDNIYQSNGVGDDVSFTNITSSYLAKKDFKDGLLYLSSGNGDNTTLSSTADYWDQNSFFKGSLYSFDVLPSGIHTRKWLGGSVLTKTDYKENTLYITDGSGDSLTLESTEGEYLWTEPLPKRDYLYIGSEESDPTGAKIPDMSVIDHKVGRFDKSKLEDPGFSYALKFDFKHKTLKILNSFSEPYAQFTQAELNAMWLKTQKYKFRLYIGTKSGAKKYAIVNNWSNGNYEGAGFTIGDYADGTSYTGLRISAKIDSDIFESYSSSDLVIRGFEVYIDPNYTGD